MAEGNAIPQIGNLVLDPGDDVIAGSYGTWRLTCEVGAAGVARGGRIRVHTDSDTDWAIPQFDDPAGADYATVEAPSGVQVTSLTQGFGSLLLTVQGRALRTGERVTITLGDRSGGGPGSRAQTFAERTRYFACSVDADANGRFMELPDPPHVAVVGATSAELIVVAPSEVVVEQPFRVLIQVRDAWGNPSPAFRGTVEIEAQGIAIPANRYTYTEDDRGSRWIEGSTCPEAGVYRIIASQQGGPLYAESNAIVCRTERSTHTLYWGDPHGGQLKMSRKIPDFFRYARDVAGISFAGYQPNAHRVSGAEWTEQQQAERDYYDPGRFVPLPGYEWSGEVRDGGHHNVYFYRHGRPIRRSSHTDIITDEPDRDSDLPHITDVHNAFRSTDTVITPHVGGGRADLVYHDPNLEPVIEVTSTHGTFEWFLRDALERGYKLGFIGGSDGYTGRPGAEYPGYLERRYTKGGLAGVYAEDLTIAGILDALRARRAYGTTGARIYVQVDANGHPMGAEYATRAGPTVCATVRGTAPLESVELYRGLERAYVHPLPNQPAANAVRILWEGASRKTSYSGAIWDGELRVSGGRVALQRTIRFDSPRSRVFGAHAEGLRWHAVSCGYRSGFILEVEGDPEIRLVVNTSLITMPSYGGFAQTGPKRMSYSPTERVSARVHVSELADGPRIVEIGLLGRRLVIERAPKAETTDITFAFTDPAPQPGTNPYWLRVVQTDMEMAWTSPVFVHYAPG